MKLYERLESNAPARAHTGKPVVVAWMRRHVEDYVDRRTGEVNTTKLAEEAAHEHGHSSWLDDETHPVWDWAIEVSEEHELHGEVGRAIEGDPWAHEYEDNARGTGRYGGIIVGIEKGDTVIYKDHRGKYRVDVITSSGGNHLTVGKAVGEPTLQDAIRLAEREAHKRGVYASSVYGGPPDHIQIGSIVSGRFQAGGDDTREDLERYVAGAYRIGSGPKRKIYKPGEYGYGTNPEMPEHRPERALHTIEHGLRQLSGHPVEVSMGEDEDVPLAANVRGHGTNPEGPIYQQGFDAAVRSGDAEKRPKTRARMLGLSPVELRERGKPHAPIDLDRREYDEWIRGWVDGWTALAAEAGVL